MRHFCLIFIAALVICIAAFPEHLHADVILPKDTVTGTVIGKNKQPLPGAKVEIVGQPYSVLTDLDGRFNIKCDRGARKVRISYPKARTVNKKIKPDMTVQIGRSWRQVPERYQWFAGANIGLGYITAMDIEGFPNATDHLDGDFLSPSFSGMAGRVKAVGWYVKYFVNPGYGYTKMYVDHANNYNDYNYGNYGYDDTYEGDVTASSFGFILGGMVRLGCPLHLYLGFGFANTRFRNIPNDLYSRSGWQGDMGLMFRIKDHIGINWSANIGTCFPHRNADGRTVTNYMSMSLTNLGVCYFFNK